MNKNEQMVETFSKMLNKLRQEKAEFNRTIDERIAALEISYETFTGEKPPAFEDDGKKVPRRRVNRGAQRPAKTGRRGMRIDRQGAAKTYAFLQERGEKPTTPKMVARKFNISPEAASQRLLNLYNAGKVARVDKGEYVDAIIVKGGAKHENAEA